MFHKRLLHTIVYRPEINSSPAIFLVRIQPSDGLAPEIAVGMAILCGFVLAFIGSFVQGSLVKKRDPK